MTSDFVKLLDNAPRAAGPLTSAAVHGVAAVTGEDEPLESTGRTGYATADLSQSFAGAVPAGQFSLHVPTVEGPDAELFWGVNMQLFTYMGVEDPWVAFIGDTLTDPVTWVPGLGALLKSGNFAKMISSATAGVTKEGLKAGVRGTSARQAWRNVKTAVEGVGAIRGNPDYARRILQAGRHGASKAEVKKLAQEGLELAAKGQIDDETKLILQAIESDPEGIQTLIRAARTLGDTSLGPQGFLQPGRAGQILAGQRSQFLRLEKPYAWMGALLRTKYGSAANAPLLDPLTRRASGAVGKVIDAVAGPARAARHIPDPIEDLTLKGYDAIRRGAADAVGTLGRVTGDMTPAMAMHQMNSAARTLNVLMAGEAGLVHGIKGVGGDDIVAGAEKLWKSGGSRSFKAMGVPFDDVKAMVVRGNKRAYEIETDAALQGYAARVDQALAQHEVSGLAAGLAEPTVQEELAKLRKVYEAFSPDAMLNDIDGVGHGVVARIAYGDMISENLGFAIDDMLRGVLPRADVRGGKELLGSLVQVPEAFVTTGDRLRLSKDALKIARKKGAEIRLADTLEAFPELARKLETEGLPMQILETAQMMGETYKVAGQSLVHAGAVNGLLQDYLPHAITQVKKVPGGPRTVQELIDETIKGADKSKLAGTLFQHVRREGKIDAANARRLLDDQLLKLEKLGIIKVEKDAVHLWTKYMTSANRAVTQSALYSHVIRTSPRTPKSWWPNRTWEGGRTPPALLAEAGYAALDARAQGSYRGITLADRLWRGGQEGAAAESLAAAAADDVGRVASTASAKKSLAARLKAESGRVKNVGSLYRKIVEKAEIDLGGGKTKPISYRQLEAWVTKGHVPRGVTLTDPVGFKQRLRIETTKQKSTLKEMLSPAELGARAAAKAEKEGSGAAHKFTMYVHKELYPHLNESFRYYDPISKSPFLRGIQKVTRNVKAGMLVADFFHYNVLAYAGMAANPRLTGAAMMNPALGGLKKQLAAGAGGALAAGAASDGDPGAMATGGLAGFLWMRSMSAARANSVAGRRMMLNPAHADTIAWMAKGGATGRPHHHAIGMVEGWLRSAGRRGVPGAASLADGQEFFERELWSLLHQGTKVMYFDTVFNRQIERLTELGEFTGKSADEIAKIKSGIAREVVMAANLNTGSLRMARFLKDPEHLRTISLLQFAPDYNMARLGHASAIFANMSYAQAGLAGAGVGVAADLVEGGFDPDHVTWNNVYMGAGMGLAMKKWMTFAKSRAAVDGKVLQSEALRIYKNAVIGVYTMSNLLNYGFTGRWMHQNPEGYKMSIAMGQDESGRDLYMSLGKPHVEALEAAHLMHKEKNSPPVLGFGIRKAHPVLRMVGEIGMNKTYWGGQVYFPEDSAWDQGSAVVTHVASGLVPIAAGGIIQAGGDAFAGELGPTGAATTVLRTAGFPTKRNRTMLDPRKLGSRHTTLDQLLGK